MDIFPTIDGYVSRLADASWADAHETFTGTHANSTYTSSTVAIRASFTGPGRGAGWYVSRCFFSFNTTGVTHVPKSGKLQIRGTTNGNIDVIHTVKATSDIESAITTSDFNSIQDWDPRSDFTGTATYYAANTSAWNTASYNIMTLTQQALVDIAGQDRLNVCLLAQRDIDNTGGSFPPIGSTAYNGLFFEDYTGTSRDPKLVITTQDDAVFMGANF